MGPTIEEANELNQRRLAMLDALLEQDRRAKYTRVVNRQPRLSELPSDAVRGVLDLMRGGEDAINRNLDYYLGPTGIPDRLRAAGLLADPGVYEGGEALADLVDPRTGGGDRQRAAQTVGELAAFAPLAFLRAPTRRPAPAGVGETAASVYGIGESLAAPRGYRSIPGRPSDVGIPDRGRFEARPIREIEQAARDYMERRGMDTSPLSSYPVQDPGRARLIASAYDLMRHDPSDPTVRRAYDAMIQETMDQYNMLRDAGIEFNFLREGMEDPYARSPAMGYQDLVENGRLWVFPTDFGFGTSTDFDPRSNPLLTRVGRVGDKADAVANDAFRAVHDAFGHYGPGNPFFRAPGEERAWIEHSRMYSPEARGAMTSETRGQNSWVNFGPYGEQNRTASGLDTVFADQKTGLLDPWTYELYGMPSAEQRDMLERNVQRWGRR